MSTPSAIIKFYDAINDLTPDYVHTRWFANDDDRDNYFDYYARTGIVWNSVQHIRVDEGVVKVPFNSKDIHAFAYMSIQNFNEIDGTGDHRYYCFIKDVEYVSDACTAVYFEVDVMQTFLHSITLWDAFVERCHGDTDDFGDNIVAEPFTPSDYFVNDEWKESLLEENMLVLGISSADEEKEFDVGGTPQIFQLTPRCYYKDIFTCVRYFKFSLVDIHANSTFKSFIESYQGQEEKKKEIVDMYICPKYCIPSYNDGLTPISTSESTKRELSPVFWYNGRSGDTNYNKISGYTPRNKKLFSYPFNFMQISNGEGDIKKYLFEYFSNVNHTPTFQLECSFIGNPSMTIYPKDYKRSTDIIHKAIGGYDESHYNYDNAITLDGYPHSGFNVDAYAMYQSQNGTSNTLKAVGATIVGALIGAIASGGLGLLAGASTGASVGAGTALQTTSQGIAQSTIAQAAVSGARQQVINRAATGAIGGAVISGTKANINNLANRIQAYNSADVTLGNNSGGNVPLEHGHKNFIFSRVACNPQFAQVVDDYFTMFGYAQNKIMNIQSYLNSGKRPYYKYLKCTNMCIHGSIENKYKTKLANIFNDGITFWFHTDMPVGKYLNSNGTFIDNSPTS